MFALVQAVRVWTGMEFWQCVIGYYLKRNVAGPLENLLGVWKIFTAILDKNLSNMTHWIVWLFHSFFRQHGAPYNMQSSPQIFF